jgi:predicted RNase H-like HicB family nuclease
MSKNVFVVQAFWDEEASVWVATSEDIPGLVTEEDTTEKLLDKLKVLIPELMELNQVKFSKKEPLFFDLKSQVRQQIPVFS